MIPSSSSHVSPGRRATALKLAFLSQSITTRSKSAVNRDPGSDQDHPVLGALHARHLRHQHRLRPAVVQVTPAPRTRVVARAGLAALRAAGRATVLDDHLNLAGRDVKTHDRDVPWGGDSADLRVEVAVAHPRRVGRA